MITWQAYPSRVTTEVNSLPNTFIDGYESVGSPRDAAATENNSTNSVFALLKGCCAGLGVPAGVGAGITNTTPKVYQEPELALGEISDARATDTGTHSAIAFLKGILSFGGI
jgi:hypothetical protein